MKIDESNAPLEAQREAFERLLSENFIMDETSEMSFYLSAKGAKFFFAGSQLEISLAKNLDKFKSDKKKGKDLFGHALGDLNSENIKIIDGTAGLGVDFCHILHTMMKSGKSFKLVGLERNPIVYTLLKFSLQDLPKEIEQNCNFICADTSEYLKINNKYDVIYLDPMFEEIQKKKSLSSQAMEALKVFCGPQKGDELLEAVLHENKESRLVVKRPLRGKIWFEKYLAHQYKGKNIRYDLYHKNVSANLRGK